MEFRTAILTAINALRFKIVFCLLVTRLIWMVSVNRYIAIPAFLTTAEAESRSKQKENKELFHTINFSQKYKT